MADDDITLEIKLEWTQRRLEESEQLVKSLRASLNSLSETCQEQRERSTVLGHRQDELIAEKNILETRIDELIKEKSELAAENASLRSVTRESAQRAALLQTADQLMAAQVGDTSANGEAILAGKLAGSRLLLSRLLWIIHRAGLRLQERDLLGPLTLVESDHEEAVFGGGRAGEGGEKDRERHMKEEVAISLIKSLGIDSTVISRLGELSTSSLVPVATSPGPGELSLRSPAPQGGEEGTQLEQDEDTQATGRSSSSGVAGGTVPAVAAPAPAAPGKPIGWFGSLFALLVGAEEGQHS